MIATNVVRLETVDITINYEYGTVTRTYKNNGSTYELLFVNVNGKKFFVN